MRAILREVGVKLGTPSRAAFANRVRKLAGAEALVMVEHAFDPRLHAEGNPRRAKQVLDIVRKEEVCGRSSDDAGCRRASPRHR